MLLQANLRKFIEYVLNSQTEKITKLCQKGLDPNFHDLDNGGTVHMLALIKSHLIIVSHSLLPCQRHH